MAIIKSVPTFTITDLCHTGLTWKEALSQCPEGIVPACHNSQNTVTISGPATRIKQFVAELKEKQVFAREVNSSGVAFHSPCMKKVAPKLREVLSKVSLVILYELLCDKSNGDSDQPGHLVSLLEQKFQPTSGKNRSSICIHCTI